MAKCHPKNEVFESTAANENTQDRPLTASQERLFEANRDHKAHTTIVHDLCDYLKGKGVVNPEEYLSLPLRYEISLIFSLKNAKLLLC